MKQIRDMTFEEIKALVYDSPDVAKEHAREIQDKLASLCWGVGLTWDKLQGTDPQKGEKSKYGSTPNKRSYTYKLRKVAGYSYP